MLTLKNINKTFDNKTVIEDISLQFKEGEIVSIVGHNGAGKTTLMKIITGLILQDSGTVEVYNQKRNKKHLKKMSLLFEGNKNFYSELNLYQNIQYFYRLRGFKYSISTHNNVDNYLKAFNLYEYAKEPVYKLSRGMQQKVSIILNFVLPSTIILLDEPTLGLDVFSIEEFEKLIVQAKLEGKIVLITSHQLDLLQRLSDKLIVLHKGKVLFDNKPNVFLTKYAPTIYTLKYNQKIPEFDIANITSLKREYKILTEKNEIVLPYCTDLKLYDYLKYLSLEYIESISTNVPKLEDAYKKFWSNEEII